MRFLRLAWMLAMGFGFVTLASAAEREPRPSKPEVRRAILATIEGQLEAFRERDSVKAFNFAVADMRRQTSVAKFAKMVQDGYPEIWNNKEADFGLVRDDGVGATVAVRVTAKDGSSAAYDYVLLKEENGAWRIGGVIRKDPRGPGSM